MENLKRVTLELSSKPFIDDSEETAIQVAEHLFRQWLPLLREAPEVAVMLWTADGSELLTWTGDENDTFEWAYWHGCAEPLPPPEPRRERDKLHTHYYPKKYREDAKPRTYAWLKRTIEVLRERGEAITGKPVTIGTTFDNGPEFALSPFKYQYHRELCAGSTVGKNRSIVCNAVMHADHRRYAAFPDGVPEGLTFGTFLGSQFREFAKHFGIDYLWLSNGAGFGRDPWGMTGFLFDKEKFFPENAANASETMLKFWHDLYAACPGLKIETRGSNFSAGVEMASDAAPLKELYREYHIAPPVNSPWAALNYNTGLELAAWMSHIAELPDTRIPFRFYIHDPWFLNSPWLDRYEREPWDLFQPMSICRLTADGRAHSADRIAFLSADDSYGRMPDQVPDEVIPLVLDAWRNAPDAAGPLVWLYPFDEYDELVRGKDPRPESVLREELFLGEALQDGLPLNTVISTVEFRKNPAAAGDSVLVTPVSAWTPANTPALEKFLASGGKIMVYGGTRNMPENLLAKLGLANAAPVTGKVSVRAPGDPEDGKCAYVHAVYNESGLCAVPASASVKVLAEAVQGCEVRVLAARSGALLYVEAVSPMPGKIDRNDRNLDIAAPGTVFQTAALPVRVLPEFGWAFTAPGDVPPRTTISRHDNAFFFSVFARDTTVDMAVASPWGMPILTGMETRLAAGRAVWRPDRFFRHECRAFVKMADGTVCGRKIHQAFPTFHDRRRYTGLVDAEVTFFPPVGVTPEFLVLDTRDRWNLLHGEMLEPEWHDTPSGRYAVVKHVTGALQISW